MKNIFLFSIAVFFCSNLNGQNIFFPDETLKFVLTTDICASLTYTGNLDTDIDADLDDDGEISFEEAEDILVLDLYASDITSLVGVEWFGQLRFLDFSNNDVTYQELFNLMLLEELHCRNNLMSFVDVSNISGLKVLNCGGNELNTLLISGLSDLEFIAAENGELSQLNLSGLSSLKRLNINDNLFTFLDVSGAPNLMEFYGHNNYFSTLDFSMQPDLQLLHIYNNELVTLNVHNNSNEEISLDPNPLLSFVCVDDNEMDYVQGLLDAAGLTDCIVDTDCNNPASTSERDLLNVNIFPSPAQSYLQIDQLKEILNYEILDLNGRNIMRGIVSEQADVLNIEMLSNGVYFLNLHGKDSKRSLKFVVQH